MLKKILLGLAILSNIGNSAELVLKNATPSQIVNGFERPGDSLGSSNSRSLGDRNLDPVPNKSPISPNKPPTPVSQNFEILFDFDSANIRPKSFAYLQNIATALNDPRLVNSNFKIEGHTDKVGALDYNIALSSRRSDSVKSFLIKSGVNPKRLTSEGKGFKELNDLSNPTSASNRRVKIIRID